MLRLTKNLLEESKKELVTRGSINQEKVHLDPLVFPEGLMTGDVVELHGAEGTGKSQYIYHILAKCLLPNRWRDIEVKGLDTGVVLMDNSYSFSMFRLVAVLEQRLLTAISNSRPNCADDANAAQSAPAATSRDAAEFNVETTDLQNLSHFSGKNCSNTSAVESEKSFERTKSDDEIESCVRQCLQKVYVVRCSSSSQLLVTLRALELQLLTPQTVRIVLVDPVDSFFDRDQFSKTECQFQSCVGFLRKLVHTYGLILIASKSDFSPSATTTAAAARKWDSSRANNSDYFSSWRNMVTHRRLFKKCFSNDSDAVFTIGLSDASNESVLVSFTIDDIGYTASEQSIA